MNTPQDMLPFWIRLAVDLDPALNPINASATHWSRGNELSSIHVAAPGPFATAQEAFDDALFDLRGAVGILRVLF